MTNRERIEAMTDEEYEIIKAYTAYGIEIPKDATYGDMIMKVLDSEKYDRMENNETVFFHEKGTPVDYCAAAFNKKLWNKPFKRGREE